MRVQSFEELFAEYAITSHGIDADDLKKRNDMLTKYKYSVIVEGEYSELENLDKWIKMNITENSLNQIWYGKTEYNYGFVEYFINEEKNATNLCLAIPNIYTVYPNSYPPGKILKSNGYDDEVMYDPENKESIIFKE